MGRSVTTVSGADESAFSKSVRESTAKTSSEQSKVASFMQYLSERWASGLTRSTVPGETFGEILAEKTVSALGGKTRKLSSTVTVKQKMTVVAKVLRVMVLMVNCGGVKKNLKN